MTSMNEEMNHLNTGLKILQIQCVAFYDKQFPTVLNLLLLLKYENLVGGL